MGKDDDSQINILQKKVSAVRSVSSLPVEITPEDFIGRWSPSGGGERANYALFLSELCRLIDVPPPDPTVPDEQLNAYVIDKYVQIPNGDGTFSTGFIDLYREGSFVLETKQGIEAKKSNAAKSLVAAASSKVRAGHGIRGTAAMETVMREAKGQAERYAKALPGDQWPPFVIVVDVGDVFEVYADFSYSGKNYAPFPDARNHKIALSDLRNTQVRETLQTIWLDPGSLDPTRRTTAVTTAVAKKLGALATVLEGKGFPSKDVGEFLLRAIFTMFAEDVELISKDSFKTFLRTRRGKLDTLTDQLETLWTTMDSGGFSAALDQKLLRFNGGLFAHAKALPIDADALDLLIDAAGMDWKYVESSIFGTIIENALASSERSSLGAHYTPREYVERLVLPTVIAPLRADWQASLTAAVTLAREGDDKQALAELRAYHRRLCQTTVLDPACGSGNFLYVTYEHMKKLEGEVLQTMLEFGESQEKLSIEGATVTPKQLLGIERNAQAAMIADLVLWLGHLQWHFKIHGRERPKEPVLEDYGNISERDAILVWDSIVTKHDPQGRPIMRWDEHTTTIHPVTGKEVPDLTSQVEARTYVNAREAQWPQADFIVGNPPFIGNKNLGEFLDPAYIEALYSAYPSLPDSADLVMYWWYKATVLTREGRCRRFGFITTKAISQYYGRRIVRAALTGTPPLFIKFAIPNHPWDGPGKSAAVRVAMTVLDRQPGPGRLVRVKNERRVKGHRVFELEEQEGTIDAKLDLDSGVVDAYPLKANALLAWQGVKLVGDGFHITGQRVQELAS